MSSNAIADLFVVGDTFVFNERGRAVKVWIQKMNDIDHDKAVKKAAAAQARVIAQIRDENSDEFASCFVRAEDMALETVIERLLSEPYQRIAAAEAAKMAEEEEWSKDSYLEGLQEAWRDGMNAVFTNLQLDDDDPEKIEATRVFTEMGRYNTAVHKAIDEAMMPERAMLQSEQEVTLREQIIPLLEKDMGLEAWMKEYNRCLVWLSVRQCDHDHHDRPTFHRKRVFETRAEVDEIQQITFLSLVNAIGALQVDTIEGKDSEETPDSSSSSESPELPGPEVSSGLVAAAL